MIFGFLISQPRPNWFSLPHPIQSPFALSQLLPFQGGNDSGTTTVRFIEISVAYATNIYRDNISMTNSIYEMYA